jgi:predicted ATPase
LIARAAASTQVVVVTHVARLVAAIEAAADRGRCASLVLDKQLGETRINNLDEADLPAWKWPSR